MNLTKRQELFLHRLNNPYGGTVWDKGTRKSMLRAGLIEPGPDSQKGPQRQYRLTAKGQEAVATLPLPKEYQFMASKAYKEWLAKIQAVRNTGGD